LTDSPGCCSFLTVAMCEYLISKALAEAYLLSNEKICFQSFFMLMTVQPSFFASAISGWRMCQCAISRRIQTRASRRHDAPASSSARRKCCE
jgi:hypothetical protein